MKRDMVKYSKACKVINALQKKSVVQQYYWYIGFDTYVKLKELGIIK